MQFSEHYNLNLVQGTDKVNPLTQDVPNYQKIDETMWNNQNRGVQECSEAFSGTTHAITCLLPTGGTFFQFTATSNYTPGDTFTFNGSVVSAFMPNGSSLPANVFIINTVVLFSISGSRMVIYSNASDLSLSGSTVVNFSNGNLLIQQDGKLAGVEPTPSLVGAASASQGAKADSAVQPITGGSYAYGAAMLCGRASSTSVQVTFPFSRPITAANAEITGTVTIRDASGTSLASGYQFSVSASTNENHITATIPVTYDKTPNAFSLVSCLFTSTSFTFS